MPIRVWHDGDDTDGTTWATAYVSIANAAVLAAAAGEEIWVASDHVQAAGTLTLTFTNSSETNPVKIISVDRADDSYLAGGSLSAATLTCTISPNIQMYGLTIERAPGSVSLTCKNAYLFGCTLTGAAVNLPHNQTNYLFVVENCAISTTGTSLITFGYRGTTIFRNCTFPAIQTNGHFIFNATAPASVAIVEDCDLTNEADIFSTFAAVNTTAIIRRCTLHASWVAIRSGGVTQRNSQLIIENCDDGTITVPPVGINEWLSYYGTAKHLLTHYRTGGADDGFNANAYSLEVVTTANTVEVYHPFRIPLGSVVVAEDATIVSATARSLYTTSRAEPLATPVVLDRSTGSVWDGANTGTDGGAGQQKIDVALSNGQTLTVFIASAADLYDDDLWIEVHEPDQVGGVVRVDLCVAKPSTTVYVDPKIVVV